MSIQVPKLLKTALASFLPVAPTVTAFGTKAGEKPHALPLLLPAATTTVIPAVAARSIACLYACDVPRPPRLILMTAGFGPLARIQSIADMMPAVVPLPASDSTFTACRVVALATPYIFPPTVPAQ